MAEDWYGGRVPTTNTVTVTNAVATPGIQSATLTSCNRSAGVVTCTTSANHNFQAGAQINIARNTTGSPGFEGAFTLTSASGTTFTYNQYDAADSSGAVTSGTAQVGSRVNLTWAHPTNDNTVMRSYIYKCTTTCTLPGNEANFSLAGVAIGNDSSFTDYGFPVTASYINNGDVPATLSAAISNDYLSTTIVSGGGTTNLVLANNAVNSVAAAQVFHDNAPNIIAVCKSFPIWGRGMVERFTFPQRRRRGTCFFQSHRRWT